MGLLSYMFGLQSKGDFGEEKIQKELNSFFLDGYRKFIQNAYVPLKNGDLTEVDLIMLHKSYIYVIESKFYQGWIFGSEKQTNWTQILNKNSKHKFYNPIKQNQTHINALSLFLGINKSKFISYIVFANNSTLKKVPESTANMKILKRENLFGSVKSIFKSEIENFTTDEVDEIYQRLIPLTEIDQETRNKHIERLKNKAGH